MHMAQAMAEGTRNVFVVADDVHPQTIAVVKTRALPLGIEVRVMAPAKISVKSDVFGVLLQYPSTTGRIEDLSAIAAKAKAAGAVTTFAADLLALTLYRAPGEMGADICIGSAQRFGVPMGFGGPHAAFMSAREEMRRVLPGRLIGVSKDAQGKRGYRLALQTREQHIRRDKATSNICTAQVLLAVMAGMYAVYHGPKGLEGDRHPRSSSGRTSRRGPAPGRASPFSTRRSSTPSSVKTTAAKARAIARRAAKRQMNLRRVKTGLAITLDETTQLKDVQDLIEVFAGSGLEGSLADLARDVQIGIPESLARTSSFLDSSGVQPIPRRTRDAALHQDPGVARSLAHPLDDSARVVHDETERVVRDAAAHSSRLLGPPSLRPSGTGEGLPDPGPGSVRLAGRDHRVSPACPFSRTPARRESTRASSPFAVTTLQGRGSAMCASSPCLRMGPTPPPPSWRASGWSWSRAMKRATWILPISRGRRTSTRIGWPPS